jgi:threonine/homoserine/homoserine lactone efflux protein
MSGLTSLHKILKDETRQKIITLLNEKGSLGYTELMGATEIGSTGLLNYHLKVLSSLIAKNESGQYLLTEKGKLASRLLMEFPEADYLSQKQKRQRKFWTVLALTQVVYLTVVLTFYQIKYLDIGQVATYTIWFIGSIFLAYLGYKLQNKRPLQRLEQEKERFKIGYILLGGIIGMVIAFFGTPIISFLSVYSGGPNLLGLIDFHIFEYITILFSAIVLGAFGGYGVGRRNCFRQPKWGKWLEEHFSV